MIDTETYDVEAEIERLEEDRDLLAEKAAEADAGSDLAAQFSELGKQTDRMIGALESAVDEYDVDAVTLTGLSGGKVARIEDAVDQGEAGKERILRVCAGTVDAPWDRDESAFAGNPEENKQRAAVAELPRGLIKWADARISDLTDPGTGNDEERASFGELVREKRRDETSDDEPKER